MFNSFRPHTLWHKHMRARWDMHRCRTWLSMPLPRRLGRKYLSNLYVFFLYLILLFVEIKKDYLKSFLQFLQLKIQVVSQIRANTVQLASTLETLLHACVQKDLKARPVNTVSLTFLHVNEWRIMKIDSLILIEIEEPFNFDF